MGNMEEQGLACACYVASRWARRALSGSGKVWNRGSLLLRHHLKVSNVKKHLRPLDPYDQNQLLHNEWIVPYYNWSSFCVKRKPPPKAILNQSNRSPLTDICRLWKALLQMRRVEECRSVSRIPPISNRTISNPVYFFAKHQRSHRATSHMFLRICLYFMIMCVCTIYSDCVNINVFRQQLSSHHRPTGAQHAQHNVFHIKC